MGDPSQGPGEVRTFGIGFIFHLSIFQRELNFWNLINHLSISSLFRHISSRRFFAGIINVGYITIFKTKKTRKKACQASKIKYIIQSRECRNQIKKNFIIYRVWEV